jgi:ferric-dicitrate binding protein FerR (iron transport regulator)
MQRDFLKDKFLSEENIEIKTAIQQFLHQEINKDNYPSTRIFHIGKWVAAASIILCIASLSWFFIIKKPSSTPAPVAKKTEYTIPDIAPGKVGAILTLSDGSKIVLDSAQGPLSVEGGTKVVNVNGKLSYVAQNNAPDPVSNTMSTPNGRQYQLVLADGSKVWLNAASSITYPTVFDTNERRVSITGEAFFEVTHNSSKPFWYLLMECRCRCWEQNLISILTTMNQASKQHYKKARSK